MSITIHNPINDSKRNESYSPSIENTKIELILNGIHIHSIKELRENFDAEEIMKYHIEGSLLKWLEQHYYENEASKIKAVETNQSGCLSKLCSAIGVDYIPEQNMTEEEKMEYNKKRSIVSEFTDDSNILSELMLVALNQEDLANLLNHGEKKIYLCKDNFSIPIRVSGIEYIGISGAKIDNPYTKTQYEKAGIKVIGFELPEEENTEICEYANSSICEGTEEYDDFYEFHTPLATILHNKLKSYKLFNTYIAPYNSSVSGKFYKSKSECETVKEKYIRKAYDDAQRHFTSGSSTSIAKKTAEFYSKCIKSAFYDNRKKLEILCSIIGKSDEYNALDDKINKCHKNLLSEFDAELNDNRDFYNMYNFDYFIDQAYIEEHDYRISENALFRTVENLFTDSVKYTISNLHSVIHEIETDVDSNANTFYSTAFSIYNSYITEIEKILDIIGKELPDIDEGEEAEDYITRCCIKKAI